MAMYNYAAIPSGDSVQMMMLNGKYSYLADGTVNGVKCLTSNELYRNGVLFTVDGRLPYFANVSEYFSTDAELDSIASFFSRYNVYEFDPSRSVPGEIVDGKTVYLDSVMNNPVWLGAYSLKDCREMEISLGLDLKGGMNVILEVSVPEVVKALADHKEDPAFNKAVAKAAEGAKNSQSDFITLFVKEYKTLAPDGNLAELFATQQLKGKVTTKSSDSEVEKVLRAEVQSAIDNSYNVLRTRIDRFGVVAPNIQKLEKDGLILVELPGIKEPERVRKLLQGSANLEFWETYKLEQLAPKLDAVNNAIAAANAAQEPAEEEAPVVAEATPDTAAVAADSTASSLKKKLQQELSLIHI